MLVFAKRSDLYVKSNFHGDHKRDCKITSANKTLFLTLCFNELHIKSNIQSTILPSNIISELRNVKLKLDDKFGCVNTTVFFIFCFKALLAYPKKFSNTILCNWVINEADTLESSSILIYSYWVKYWYTMWQAWCHLK